jgi:hypothetical protein
MIEEYEAQYEDFVPSYARKIFSAIHIHHTHIKMTEFVCTE